MVQYLPHDDGTGGNGSEPRDLAPNATTDPGKIIFGVRKSRATLVGGFPHSLSSILHATTPYGPWICSYIEPFFPFNSTLTCSLPAHQLRLHSYKRESQKSPRATASSFVYVSDRSLHPAITLTENADKMASPIERSVKRPSKHPLLMWQRLQCISGKKFRIANPSLPRPLQLHNLQGQIIIQHNTVTYSLP